MHRSTTHALYRSKLWQQDHCQHPQNANPDGSTCPGWWKQSFRQRLGSLVWFQVWATSCHLTSSKSAWKSTPPPLTWSCWTTSFGHTLRTSPTWPPTIPKPTWLPPSAEYSPSSCRRLWKRHAPRSGSVSRRWLSLIVATLNRCQLHYIIKLPELIFSKKVLR